jgi:hypothetical protein
VKTSAVVQGTPVAYGQILEWRGKPQADIFWGEKAYQPIRKRMGLLADSEIVAVSAITGEGLPQLVSTIVVTIC